MQRHNLLMDTITSEHASLVFVVVGCCVASGRVSASFGGRTTINTGREKNLNGGGGTNIVALRT